MFIAYRYLPNIYPPGSIYPTLPFESIIDAYDLNALPSLDEIEHVWNQQPYLPFMFHYEGKDVYYFILSINKYLTDTYLYRRLDFSRYALYDDRDQYCDIHAKRILLDFMRQFESRIHTRNFIQEIIHSITESPTEIEYHEQIVHHLSGFTTHATYDTVLIESVLHISNTVIETERRFRPGGDGFKEAQTDFETICMKHL